ncbi:hypothetical protein [Psychroserpens algicola]|uniref:hypothetical protein n=1 Tax=Psychroserpens algicola TaxID=1719034 RepID=UPI001954F78E|nr:hypothetical protein [Psychroserpens algicola]
MKTKTIITKSIGIILLFGLLSTNFGCAALFDAELDGQDIPRDENGMIDFKKLEEQVLEDFRNNQLVAYPQHFIETSGGFGLNSTEGDSETSFCIGAGYNHRISKDNFNTASYLKGFATHHSQSADDRKLNVTRVGAGYTLFDRASKNGKLDLTYGIDLSYGFGTLENFDFKEDLTEYRGELKVGANYSLSSKLDLGVTIPIASWSQQNYESDGFEFEQQNTWIGINKDNLIMGYARIKLD